MRGAADAARRPKESLRRDMARPCLGLPPPAFDRQRRASRRASRIRHASGGFDLATLDRLLLASSERRRARRAREASSRLRRLPRLRSRRRFDLGLCRRRPVAVFPARAISGRLRAAASRRPIEMGATLVVPRSAARLTLRNARGHPASQSYASDDTRGLTCFARHCCAALPPARSLSLFHPPSPSRGNRCRPSTSPARRPRAPKRAERGPPRARTARDRAGASRVTRPISIRRRRPPRTAFRFCKIRRRHQGHSPPAHRRQAGRSRSRTRCVGNVAPCVRSSRQFLRNYHQFRHSRLSRHIAHVCATI